NRRPNDRAASRTFSRSARRKRAPSEQALLRPGAASIRRRFAGKRSAVARRSPMCPIPIRSFSSWKVATFLVVAGLIHAPTPSRADDEAEPPAVRTYSVRVLELETGAPVVGITIRVRENLTTWHCYRMENGICTDCHS